MATTAISKIGVVLTIGGKNVVLFEDDTVTGLQFQVQGGKLQTLDGKVRVIVATTKANTETPDVCPPEPYVHRYVIPTAIVLDYSDEHDAKLIRIDVNNILAIDKVNGTFATPEYDLNGKPYFTIEEAMAAAQPGDMVMVTRNTDLVTKIPTGVSAQVGPGYVLAVPQENAIDVLHTGTGAVVVMADGALALNNENIIGKDGRMIVVKGNTALNIDTKKVTVPSGSVVNIPATKTMYLLLDYKNGTRETLDGVIEAGATVTVNGGMKVPALDSGATLTVEGTLQIEKSGDVNVSSTARINGSGNIVNNGVMTFAKSSKGEAVLDAEVTLGMTGVVYTAFDTDLTSKIINGKRETGTYEVAVGDQVITFTNRYIYSY